MLYYEDFGSAETSLMALIRFAAIKTDAIDSFSLTMKSSQSSDRSMLHYDDENAEVRQNAIRTINKGGKILKKVYVE